METEKKYKRIRKFMAHEMSHRNENKMNELGVDK